MTAMNRTSLLLAALLLPLTSICMAEQTAPTVEIVAIAPADDALAINDPLYIHIRYSSSEPLRFQAQASGSGAKEAGAMMNPSPAYPAGEGEAIAWIAFRQYFKPDSITLRVSSHSWKTLSEIPVVSNVFWSPGADSKPRPEWANRLSNEQQAVTSQQLQAAHTNDGGGDWLIFLMAWSVPGYFLLQGWVWLRWHDRWRKAGLLPLWAGVPATGHAVFALLMGSNLWPIVMLFVLPVLTVYLAVVATIRLLKA